MRARTMSFGIAALLLSFGCGGGGGSEDSVGEVADSSGDSLIIPDVKDTATDIGSEVDEEIPDWTPDLVQADVADLVDPEETIADVKTLERRPRVDPYSRA